MLIFDRIAKPMPAAMKKLAIFFLFLISVGSSPAQDKIPAFGKIDKTQLEMKDCDFDAGAEALILLDVGDIKFTYIQGGGWESESVYRMRVKVFKASALNRAEITIPYYSKSGREYISGISGISFNLDAAGNMTETILEKNAVFDKKIDKEYSEVSFALPDVRIGTVFEYKYKLLRKSFGYIPPWQFQQRVPVKYSAYKITIPAYFHFSVQATQRQQIEKKDEKSAGEGTWYIMRNIPGLKDEPYSTGIKNYLQRIEFQLSKIESPSFYQEYRNTWPKIASELLEDEDFGLAIKKNIRGTEDLTSQVANANSRKEKIKIVYNYVQSNMQWNQAYSKYSERGIKDAWDKKNGNITDINFILIRFLRDAGIDAHPLLASTKDNGPINIGYPFLNQFNCVLAYVKDENTSYVMNAADKFNSFDLVPYDVLYTNGLLVREHDVRLISLNSDRNYKNIIGLTAYVDAGGQLTGQATIQSTGYAKNIRLSTYKENKLKEIFENNIGIDIKVDSLVVNNEKDEILPLEQKFNFNANLQQAGAYSFLPYALFTGIGKNPFIEESRVMDVDFDFPKSYIVFGTYYLTNDYIVNTLPKNTRMIMPDTSISLTRVMQVEENMISFKFTLDIKTPGYDAASYPYVKEFFKKMYAILDERIVLQKK